MTPPRSTSNALQKWALLPLLLLLLAGRSPAQEGALDARNWQLFIDDYAVARETGFDRVVHHPRPMGVVIAADKPWESFGASPNHFLRKADGTFVGFYTAIWWAPLLPSDIVPGKKVQRDRAQQYAGLAAYATSKDGIHWVKPILGLVDAPAGIDWKRFPPFPSPVGLSKENNLGVPFDFEDLGQYGNVSDPARRYAISLDGKTYYAADLPDFVNDPQWRSKLVNWDMKFGSRSGLPSYWDAQHGEWVAISQNTTPHWLPTRTVARFASKDLKNWRSELVLSPDAEDSHTPGCYDEPMGLGPFYSEGSLLAYLSWIHTDRTTPDGGPVMPKPFAVSQGWPWPETADYPFGWPWARKGVNEVRITISRDGGKTWDRTSSREAWIPHGTEQDAYDRIVLGAADPVRVGDEDWFYAGVYDGDHLSTRSDAQQRPYYSDRMRKGQIALYIQKHDRYVSLSTGSQVETLITKPFVVDGDTLQLNVDASRGTVRVGIAEFRPVPTPGKGGVLNTYSTDPYLMEQNIIPGFSKADCQPIESNSIEQVVSFKGDSSLKAIRGRTVILFIEALDSDLYGFRIR